MTEQRRRPPRNRPNTLYQQAMRDLADQGPAEPPAIIGRPADPRIASELQPRPPLQAQTEAPAPHRTVAQTPAPAPGRVAEQAPSPAPSPAAAVVPPAVSAAAAVPAAPPAPTPAAPGAPREAPAAPAAAAPAAPPESTPTVRPGELTMWQSLLRYRVFVVAVMVLATVVAAGYVLTRTPVYTATATIIVSDPANIPLLNQQSANAPDRYVSDQAVVLRSSALSTAASALGQTLKPPVTITADYFQHHTVITTAEATNNQITVAFTASASSDAVAGSDLIVTAYRRGVHDHLIQQLQSATSQIDAQIATIDQQLASPTISAADATQLTNQRGALFDRRQEITTAAGAQNDGIALYDAATSATESARRAALPIALLIIVGAGLISLGIAYVTATMRRPVSRPEEAAALVGAPVSAMVPTLREGRLDKPGASGQRGPTEAWPAFRVVATALSAALGRRHTSVAVIAARRGDGCTTITANLGITLAVGGARAVVVDGSGDGGLTRMLGLDDDGLGWTDVLQGSASLAAVLRTVTLDGATLTLLPAGRRRSMAAELLPTGSMATRLAGLLRELEGGFDYVLVDTAPLLSGGHGFAMTSLASALLVTVRDGAPVADLEQVRSRLTAVRTPVVACVVNHPPERWLRLLPSRARVGRLRSQSSRAT
jgi:Mrp family chromosome partitioning ATPase